MSSSFTQILHITRGGMLSRLLNLDVVSHNISNINTTGYKRNRANFQEMLEMAQLSGTQIRSTQHIMAQGSLVQTTNPLDLAVNGEGFFAVILPDERTSYTRDGEFYVDKEYQLVNANGFRLVWDGEIPADVQEIHVNPDGSVMVKQEDEWSEVGKIQLYRFPNPSGLMGYGENQWLESEVAGEVQSGTPGTGNFGIIVGNAKEQSNVSLAEEMVLMASLQRSFEMSLRAFQQTDQMLSQAIQMRRV